MPSDSPSPAAAVVSADDAAFVLCIENNETRDQALLLIESIRAFCGRFAKREILAVAPRPGLGVDAPTRARLEALEVTYHEAPLNTVCPEYGSANRVYAAAWAADTCHADTLFVLDSDTLFLGEPEALAAECDLAVRPVDVTGSTTGGLGDAFESYWTALCDLAGISIESLPFVETVLDRRRVRASYNGGYAVVRRGSGILQRAADLFTRSVRSDLRPYEHGGHAVFASTGFVSPRAGEYWGSNQAALSIAAWSTTRRVRLLDRRYNVPLHGLADPLQWSDDWLNVQPIHLHYHWMLRASHREQALRTMARIGVPADRLEWIEARSLLREIGRSSAPSRSPGHGRQLVICGMHRSATSLVASVLRHAGLEIGEELMGSGPGNPRGHFEDRDFWQLHEDMLAAAGTTALTAGDDFAPPAGGACGQPPPAGGGFERRAIALIEQRAGVEAWGWKDPRTCLFLDFWDALLPNAGYLLLYRHPIEVALSLRRRATEPEVRLDPWAGIRAWEVYNRRLLAFLERHRERCFVAQVPALTADLPAFVRRIGAEFGLPLHEAGAASLFAAGELATHLETDGERAAWDRLIPEALSLYRRLEENADLPSWMAASRRAGPGPETRRAIEALFYDLHEARGARAREAAAVGGQPEALQRAGADGRRAWEKVRTELEDSRRMTAELRRRLAQTVAHHEEAAARRDDLAATLAAIEGSRSFALAAGWWRLAGWLRRLGRNSP